MIKPFFDRRVEKRRLSGANTRLFKEVYRKMSKSDGQFIFFSFLILYLMVLLQACIMPKEFDMPISVICNCVPQSLIMQEDAMPVKEDLEFLSNKKKQLFLDCLARADFMQKTAFEVQNKMPRTLPFFFYDNITKNCPDALEFLKLIRK